MVIIINILILLGIIILLFIPATKTIQVKNYSLMVSLIAFFKLFKLSWLLIVNVISIFILITYLFAVENIEYFLLLSFPLFAAENFEDLIVLSVPFYISNNDKYKKNICNLILILPVMVFAGISIYSPTFMFFFMLLFVSVSCFFSFSSFIEKYLQQYDFYLIKILQFSHQYGILNFLGRLHVFIFYCGDKNFYIRAFIIHLMSFIYILLTRYYYYNFFLLQNTPFMGIKYFLFLFISFICLIAVYIRVLITLSIIFINHIEILLPDLLPEVLKVEPFLPPEQSQHHVISRSLLHVSYNNHNHHYPKPRMSSWGKFGIGLGVCTLCVGSYTAYNSYLTAQAAIIQAHASTIQAQVSISQLSELQRQNDLQERAQGLISSEEYAKKWKK